MERFKSFLTSRLGFLVYGVLLGALILLGIRYITYHPAETHYHANFAVYINGQQEQFKDPRYYEEVVICSLHNTMTPQMRTHMHDEENGVVHVHDEAVTWGQFFNNLGWNVGSNFISTQDTIYTADDSNKLNIILNGQNLTGLSSITNQVIEDKDRLLVSFGPNDTGTLDKEYASVPNNAAKYDSQADPAACASPNSSAPRERLKHLF